MHCPMCYKNSHNFYQISKIADYDEKRSVAFFSAYNIVRYFCSVSD